MSHSRKNCNRYIIVGHQRSGTTITHLALKGHPNVSAVNDEVKISPLFTQGIATFTVSKDSYLTLKEKEENFSAIFDAITRIEADENTMAAGLKIATTSPKDAASLVKCLQTYLQDLTVIWTIREDLIAQYGSSLRLSATGQSHSWRKNQIKNEFSVEIPREQFIKYAIKSLKTSEEIKKLETTHKVIKVFYEKDILPNTLEVYYNLFEVLGLPQLEIKWLNSQKIAPSPEKYIINYSELREISEEIKNGNSDLLKFIEIQNDQQELEGIASWLDKIKSKKNKIKNKLKRIQAILKE